MQPSPRPARRSSATPRPLLAALLIAVAGSSCGGDRVLEPPAAVGVTTVRITAPSIVMITVDERKQFVAQAFDASGQEVAGAPLTWSVDDPALARVDQSGEVTALAAGTTTLRVTSGRAGWSVTLYLIPHLRTAAVNLFPRRVILAVGDTATLTARLFDSTGGPIANGASPVAFRSDSPEIAGTHAWGWAIARAIGTTRITAMVDGVESSTEVQVVERRPSAFGIDVRVIGDSTVVPLPELRAAAARWSRVIVGGAAPQRATLAAGACRSWTPAVEETIEHLVVFVRAGSFDGPGGIIAGSGPCALRENSRQPVVATLEIDQADIAAERARGSLQTTLTHELGHALGFGSTWFFPEPSLVEIREQQQGYEYIGAAARAAAVNWGAVPRDQQFWLENRGGAGTAASHWHPKVVGSSELMTAFGFPGAASLSTMTVGAMRDLGYDVDESAADWRYAPARTGPMAALRAESAEPGLGEWVTPPRLILGRDGRPLPH